MKVLLAQINYQIGNIKDNTARIVDAINTYGNNADLIVFSELCITGYYPRDLLYQDGLIDKQDSAMQEIKDATKNVSAGAVIGYVERNTGAGKQFFNSLALIENGHQIFNYRKSCLPVYNIFDEMRHFEPGNSNGIFEYRGTKLGFLICEDAWDDMEQPLYTYNPVEQLMKEEVNLVISINASPCNIGKQEERYEVISKLAKNVYAPVVYVNQIGGVDDLIFDGGSCVVDTEGNYLLMSASYEEGMDIFDSEASKEPVKVAYPSDIEVIAQQLKVGLGDYCKKTGFSKVVVGSSGGIDSAVTLALAAWVLGPENVIAVTMPSQFSSEGSWGDSEDLCENLGIKLFNYPIEQEFNLDCTKFEAVFGKKPSGLTQENIQARTRAKILMAFSNDYGNLVLSTGNKSEISVGYCTLGGDMMGGLSVLGDLYKMEVYALARYLNESVFKKEAIPLPIIEKEPSAELSPDQKDSDSLPDYPILDAILKLYIELDYLSEADKQDCESALVNTSQEEIDRVKWMVGKAEYKRQQAAPVLRVHARAFGSGRQIPLCSKL